MDISIALALLLIQLIFFLTIRQLQYLQAVMATHHFGKAAEQCFVTQSTLSSGIQELEQLLGVTLFERTKRKVIPTMMGEQIAVQAQHILQLNEALVETCQSAQQPLTGTLRLGVIPTIGPYLLPWVLPEIRRLFPQLHLQLIEDQSEKLLDRLEMGQLDSAILALPYALRQFEHEVFWQEDFCVALPKQHPLATQRMISTQMLPRQELLLLEEGHCLTAHALSACQLDDLALKQTFQGTSLYTLLQMVAGGQGITFVPEMAIYSEQLNQKEISLVSLNEPSPHRKIGLVWRKSFMRKPDLILLSQHIRQIMHQTVNNMSQNSHCI